MDRWRKEWSGDWNGDGPALVDALKAAASTHPKADFTFEADIAWNLRGVRARYDDLEEARERLSYSAPAPWITLSLYEGRSSISRDAVEDLFGPPEPRPSLELSVKVTETQVKISVDGENPFTAKAMFDAGKKVIERKAVTKIPHHLRHTATPKRGSRWTRTMAWIERHPAIVALIVGILGALASVAGALLT